MLASTLTCVVFFFFFFNDTATTEIYTLSLHDALPIFNEGLEIFENRDIDRARDLQAKDDKVDLLYSEAMNLIARSEEHTSELQSRQYLVCRLLLEKKKKTEI